MAIQSINPQLLTSLGTSRSAFSSAAVRLATQSAFASLNQRSAALFATSTRLQSQSVDLDGYSRNLQFGRALLRAGEDQLASASGQLANIRSLVYQANSGFADDDTRAILTGAIDSAVSQLQQTLARRSGVLAGPVAQSPFQFTDDSAGIVSNLQVTQTPRPVGDGIALDVSVARTGTRATQVQSGFGGGVEFELNGSRGSSVVSFQGGSAAEFASAVNAETQRTGVVAVVSGADVELRSEAYGSNAFVRSAVVSDPLPAGFVSGTTSGSDALVSVNGVTASAQGNAVRFDANGVVGSFTLDAATVAGTTTSIEIVGGGLTLPTGGGASVTIGVPAFGSDLGSASGVAGGLSSLASANFADQLAILNDTESTLLAGRVQLGVVDSGLSSALSANQTLAAEVANAQADLSSIDVAREATALVQSRLQSEVQIALLRQALAGQAGVLRLLGQSDGA